MLPVLPLPTRDRDRVAPLGLAFLDGPGGVPVLAGLSVTAWRDGREEPQVVATVNGAGVAGFHRLPGVAFNPADPFAGPTRPIIVEVRDPMGRFLAGRVRVNAPARGVAEVVVWSAPGRAVVPGRLAFRAEVWDATNDRPAAFALLTVRVAGNGNGTVATGLADDAGRVLAVGDWPTPKAPGAGPATRWDSARPIAVEVRYASAAPPPVPRLDQVTGVPVANVWDRRGPDVAYVPPDIVPGLPGVLRSAQDPRGRLLVTAV